MRVLWSSEVKELNESLDKLKRYNELVIKLSSKAPFNPVVGSKQRLTDEEYTELYELRGYFGNLRVNEAGIFLVNQILNGKLKRRSLW